MATGADLPQFIKDEFDAFLACRILAHGFLRLRCGDGGAPGGPRHPSYAGAPVGAVAADPLRPLLAAQPKLVAPVLQVVHRVITRFLLKQAGAKADEAISGAVTLVQRFGSAANVNIHLHRLLLSLLEFMQRLAALAPR